MIDRGLEPDFPVAAQKELAAIGGPAKPTDNIRDQRNLLWASIDNDDSRDLDQLTVAASLAAGQVRILVAVADVDALVRKASALDGHAAYNTTSVYTPAAIFPMLPEALSTDLTSLNEDQDRIAIVSDMVFKDDGTLVSSELYRALVRNRAKLAYNSVAAWLTGAGPAPKRIAETPGLDENLRLQDRVAQRLTGLRHHHGALSLETLEAKLLAGNSGYDIVVPSNEPTFSRLIHAGALAEQVKAGKLPPVAQRIPAEPLVWQPLNEIGTYGGTWRRAFTGPGDGENGNRIQSSDKPLHWSADGSKIVPCVAKGYTLSEDGKTYTLFLRKGMKWSDGAPFTADDFIFWFEDIYGNPDIVPTPTPEMRPKGKPGRMVKVDETTVRWDFDVPYYLFEEIMAGDTAMGGGQAVRQAAKISFGAYAPGHYLKQFLPKYSSLEAVNARAKQEGFENWVQMLHFKKDWELNTEVPVLGPWRTVRPINTAIWLLERNPYYYAVDTAGNQLPYFDKVQFTLAENLEIINLRAMAGEYDEQERHIDLGKLPVLLELGTMVPGNPNLL